jgi:hypothetical protein
VPPQERGEMDQIIVISIGIMFLTAGVGFSLAKADKAARERDEKRFGPLSNFGIGGWYILMQNRTAKCIFCSLCILLGLIFIVYGLSGSF